MPDLPDQTVLITGAAQGLGAAIARVFGRNGARLILMDIDDRGLTAVANSIDGAVKTLAVDLADAKAMDAVLTQISEPVDTLIHNAAILNPMPMESENLASFRATLDVGIQAAFQLTQSVWPGMRARGSGALIYMSSQSGIKGFADETAYCAAKHALEGFSKCLALEGAAHGILSCTITPGKAMHTPMSERNYPPELKAEWIDPERLAPAFVEIATQRDMTLSGQRLNAWTMSEPKAA